MQKSLLVRVFTPKRSESQPGQIGECATGYPVAADLVLTCRHAVRPKDRDPSYPIEVQWHCHPESETRQKWFKLGVDENAKIDDEQVIVWESEEFDAALLSCKLPPGLHGWGHLVSSPPVSGRAWESGGFPKVAKYDSEQHQASFRGSIHSMPDCGSHFEIDVNVAPTSEKDWSGASGMPICLEGTNLIVGVLKQVACGWGSQKAHATPSFKLLRCSTFRKKIGRDDQEKRQASCVKAMSLTLNKSTRAVEAIRVASGLCDGVIPTAEAVASRLADMHDAEAVAKGLRQAYNEVRKERALADSASLRKAELVLVEAVQLLVPFQCDSGLVAPIREQLVGPGAVIAEIPCALEMVAEIYMAAAEQRRTDYWLRRGDGDYPRGKRNRPAPPIAGMNDTEAKIESIRTDLDGKFAAGMWRGISDSIDDIMIQSLARSTGGPQMTADERKAAAAIQLDTLAGDGRGRYYLVCRMPVDDNARNELEAGLQALSQTYKSLVVLKLTGDGATSILERRTFGHFNQMLPKGG